MSQARDAELGAALGKLTRKQLLSATEAVTVALLVVDELERLHSTGHFHGSVSVDRSALDVSAESVTLVRPEWPRTISSDASLWPRAFHSASGIQLTGHIQDDARTLSTRGTLFEPVRIDVYQTAVQLIDWLTGASPDQWLLSPSVAGQVDRSLRLLIDDAIGERGESGVRSVALLRRRLLELRPPEAAADVSEAGPASRHGSGEEPVLSPQGLGDAEERDGSSEVSQSPASPIRMLGHYQVLERIGAGGMGEVYRAFEPALNRTVAIKILPAELSRNDDWVQRFYAEATAAAKIDHPNVVSIFYIGQDNSADGRSSPVHFFAMQFVDGEPLTSLLERRGRLSTSETVSLARQLLAGLSAAHRAGVIHRDIKPGNILLDRQSQRAMLADFGLARSFDGSKGLTATGTVLGTVDYISPEQARGQQVDARSDLYSVGVVIYRMLSGRLPFEADSPTGMIFQHVYEQPSPLEELVPNVPASIADIVKRLLEKSPDRRFASALDVDSALSEVIVPAGDHGSESLVAVSNERSSAAVNVESQTRTIFAPVFTEGPLLEVELRLPKWRRIARWFQLKFRAHAPEFVQQLQSTQMQIAGAIAEYERRCQSLSEVAEKARSVLHELESLAESHEAAARKAEQDSVSSQGLASGIRVEAEEHGAAAMELRVQADEQRVELESIELQFDQTRARLARLQSQQEVLQARLKAAQPRGGFAETRPETSFATRVALLLLLILAGTGAGLFVTAQFADWWAAPSTATQGKHAFLEPAVTSNEAVAVEVETGIFAHEIPEGISSLALSETGVAPEIVVGTDDGRVQVYALSDEGTFRELYVVPAAAEPIHCLAVLPKSKLIATSSGDDGNITVWRDRHRFRELAAHSARVTFLQFLPDGERILSGDARGNVKIHELVSEKPVVSVKAWQLYGVKSASLSVDEQRLLVGSDINGAHSIRLWQLTPLQQEAEFDTEKARTDFVRFLPDEDRALVLTGKPPALGIWDTRDHQMISTIISGDGSKSRLRCAAATEDCRRAVVGSDGYASVWDTDSLAEVGSRIQFSGSVRHVAISADGRFVVGASSQEIRAATRRPLPLPSGQTDSFQLENDGVRQVSFLKFAHDIAVVGERTGLNSALVRDVAQTGIPESDILNVSFDRDIGTLLSTRISPDFPVFFSPASNTGSRSLPTFRRLDGHSDLVVGTGFMHSGAVIVSASRDRTVRVWDTDSESLLFDISLDSPATDLATTARSGDLFVVACEDGSVAVMDFKSRSCVRTIDAHAAPTSAVAIASDGLRFVSSGADPEIKVWGLRTGEQLMTLEGHRDSVTDVFALSDGRSIVSGSRDRSVRVWNVDDGMETRRFSGHFSPVTSVGSLPSRTHVISGDASGRVIVWNMSGD